MYVYNMQKKYSSETQSLPGKDLHWVTCMERGQPTQMWVSCKCHKHLRTIGYFISGKSFPEFSVLSHVWGKCLQDWHELLSKESMWHSDIPSEDAKKNSPFLEHFGSGFPTPIAPICCPRHFHHSQENTALVENKHFTRNFVGSTILFYKVWWAFFLLAPSNQLGTFSLSSLEGVVQIHAPGPRKVTKNNAFWINDESWVIRAFRGSLSHGWGFLLPQVFMSPRLVWSLDVSAATQLCGFRLQLRGHHLQEVWKPRIADLMPFRAVSSFI